MSSNTSSSKEATITLTQEHIRKLSAATGVSIRGADDLIREVDSMSRMSVAGIDVKLLPELQRRFMARNHGNAPVEQYVQDKLGELISEFCGW